ncbi:MAG: hypothetical protein KIS94_05180 [Chitinophagales bacterium]|nr:hypothetical protein [Chitinophagales bacterium]
MEPIKVKREDLEFSGYDGGGSPIYKYDSDYFTGIILDYNNQGNLIGETEYRNGYIEGIQREYYASGQLKQEYQEKDNLLNGVYKEWDEDGKLISESKWKNGEKVK